VEARAFRPGENDSPNLGALALGIVCEPRRSRINLCSGARRRVGIFLRFISQESRDWILLDVGAMSFVILGIFDATLGETFLPNFGLEIQLLRRAKRKSALDILNRFFDRNIFRGSNQQMEMVRHDNEFV
jgi:hypothetical protein